MTTTTSQISHTPFTLFAGTRAGKVRTGIAISLLLIFNFIVSGCGGGGSSGDSSAGSYTYSGKTTPAVLTETTARRFFTFLYSGVLTAPPTGAVNGVPKMAPLLRMAKSSARTLASTPVDGVLSGMVSGSAAYSGALEQNGTGTVTFTYRSFNNGTGYSYDGSVRFSITAFDPASNTITDGLLQFSDLTVASAQVTFAAQGSVRMTTDVVNRTETMTLNIDGRSAAEPFRLENLKITTTLNSLTMPTASTEVFSGRIYLGTDGYVDISHATPFRYDYYGRFNVDVPNAGGPLLFSGAASGTAKFTPLSVSRLAISVDGNGDGLFESSVSEQWSKLAGIIFTWKNTYGSPGFDVGYSARETSDGGTIATGFTNTATDTGIDVYLVKTDAAGGVEWTRTFGDTGDDVGWSVQQTADQGYVIAGVTSAASYIIKTDATGSLLWERRLSTGPPNRALSIRQTSDGGYIVCGAVESFVPGVVGLSGYGMEDLYLVKLDAAGAITWEKRFGGSGTDVGWTVKETVGGGFVMVGVSDSFSASRREQMYVVKTDATGSLIWERTYGDGQLSRYGYDIEAASDGTFAVSGYSATLDRGNVYYLARIGGNGDLLWETTFGSTDSLYHRNSLAAAADGGYLVVGNSSFDVQLFRTDSSGSVLWTRNHNWSQFSTMCTASSVVRTSDGGYLIGGSAWPDSGKDFLLIRTDADGLVK